MKKIPSTSRSRRSSSLVFLRFLTIAAITVLSSVVAAQPISEARSSVLVIDQDRLFAETNLGTAARQRLDEQVQALVRENQRIEAELIERERELTDLRPETEPEAFRALADEFDSRVERIRAEQDEKERVLNRAQEQVRQEFFRDVAGVISDIVRERGAVAVIDRRAVFLSADWIDITDEAIQRVNRTVE